MANDFSLELRRAVVAHLRSWSGLTALISVASIHGERAKAQPTFPFILMGLPVSSPFEATCWDGSSHSFVINVFCKGPFTDDIEAACKQVIDAMPGLDVAGLSITDNELTGKQIIRDTDEQDAYHAILNYRITLVETV